MTTPELRSTDTSPDCRILVVDDDPVIVDAVNGELTGEPFTHYHLEVEGFTDPQAALDRAGAAAFDAVICASRMPGMDGLELLKRLATLQPDCARLVLSGETDVENLVRMVNETHIYRFIPKPWHDYFLKGSLVQALDHARALAENRRLANLVREKGIVVPSLDGKNDQILIVDHDPEVLASLSQLLTRRSPVDALFSAIRTEVTGEGGPLLDEARIRVLTADSAAHALELGKAETFSCIIAAYNMRAVDGGELLQVFADEQPDCARLLISGRISQEDLVTAVDMAHIFGFIEKPWRDFDVKATVAQALAFRHTQVENRLLAEMMTMATQAATLP